MANFVSNGEALSIWMVQGIYSDDRLTPRMPKEKPGNVVVGRGSPHQYAELPRDQFNINRRVSYFALSQEFCCFRSY
jgi:hypothetical protein